MYLISWCEALRSRLGAYRSWSRIHRTRRRDSSPSVRHASPLHMAVRLTLRSRGNDLFRTDVGTRLRYGLDFQYVSKNAQEISIYAYMMIPSAQFLDPTNRQPVPSFLCSHKGHLNYTLGPGTLPLLATSHTRLAPAQPSWPLFLKIMRHAPCVFAHGANVVTEVGLNAMHFRLGYGMVCVYHVFPLHPNARGKWHIKIIEEPAISNSGSTHSINIIISNLVRTKKWPIGILGMIHEAPLSHSERPPIYTIDVPISCRPRGPFSRSGREVRVLINVS